MRSGACRLRQHCLCLNTASLPTRVHWRFARRAWTASTSTGHLSMVLMLPAVRLQPRPGRGEVARS